MDKGGEILGGQVNKKTSFFDYFHRAQREGLTDAEAYKWAITEDLYDANDCLLNPGEATADGMCFHPQFAVVNMQPHDYWFGQRQCCVCGRLLFHQSVGERFHERTIYIANPSKIETRSEVAARILMAVEGK
jgi:hypothetical protein